MCFFYIVTQSNSLVSSTTSNESYENTFKEIASVDDLPQFSSVFLPILCSTQQEINRVLSCRSFTISANKSETVQIKVFKTFLASCKLFIICITKLVFGFLFYKIVVKIVFFWCYLQSFLKFRDFVSDIIITV